MLTEAEMVVGVVAYLDPAMLDADPMVLAPASPTEGRRPFVCIGRAGKLSAWMALTSQAGPNRSHLAIPTAVRRRGRGVWRTGPSFANKVFATYIGPHASFIGAAAHEDDFDAEDRPGIDPAWVERELIPRSRERQSLDFSRWHKGCGAKQAPALALPEAKVGKPLLTREQAAGLLPPPAPKPVPVPRPAEATPTAENWTEFIDAAPGGKGPGRR